ncbi:MAG: hypothetical protein WA885_04040 [Phormidesmis sp.]
MSSVLTAGLVAIAPPASAQDFIVLESTTESSTVPDSTAEGSVVEGSLIESDEFSTGVEEIAVEQAAESEEAELNETEPEAAELAQNTAVESEAALLELNQALAADFEEPAGALILSNLESASIEASLPVETERLDLAATSDMFTVESDSMPALTTALNSDNVLTRLYAADALWTLTGNSEPEKVSLRDRVLPILIEAAVSDNMQARELAVSGLAQLGEQALPAVPVLNQLVGARDSRTRRIAQNALTVVRSGNPAAAALGIVARESRRRLLPAAVRAITGLWR